MFDKEQSYHEHTENTTCACKHTEPVSLTSNMHQCCHIFPQTTTLALPIQPLSWRHSAKQQIFWHSFWHIFWHIFLTYLSDILSDISFDMLSDISSDILSDISKTKHSIHSFTQKPLHKLYIYLTPRSKSNIHDSFVSVKWQFYSCIRLHRTAPPRSSWVQRCKAPAATHTPHASDRPAKKAVESKRCNPGSGAATTSHGVCKPWSQMLATVVLSPFLCRWLCSAHHLFPTRALQSPKTRPKYERLQRASHV